MTREEAIAVLENERPACGEKVTYSEGEICEAYEMAIEALQERPKGRWIFNNRVHYVDECHCSLCGQVLSTYKGERKNFCPNCGADMRGEEE